MAERPHLNRSRYAQPLILIADARRHGVTVLPVDINHSAAHPTLEPQPQPQPATPRPVGLRSSLAWPHCAVSAPTTPTPSPLAAVGPRTIRWRPPCP
ncbi:hypothetical protein [Kitasatospora sp. NPDC058218]|uniref:hypothetical protein n=1 Tax=Kitasatospora sp. NPDC058218 TaxID=3346385 RepID=UPI0036D8EB5C